MATIGDVEFNVLTEDRLFDSEVTSHPVEGGDISDHIDLKPRSYSITGVVTGSDSPKKHSQLSQLRNSRELTRYVGRAVLKNCVIKSYTTSVDSVDIEGFTFTMEIREIKIAKPSTIGLLPMTLKVNVADVGNAGRVQTR